MEDKFKKMLTNFLKKSREKNKEAVREHTKKDNKLKKQENSRRRKKANDRKGGGY
jgi:hypothetical protein